MTSSGIDFSGARGSTAGDVFHELWALQNVLALLVSGTSLSAVGVEGVRSEADASISSSSWDGVDCALYYGGDSLQSVERVEFVQLKYSAASPERNWTVARIAANNTKTSNNSPIRKLADDFKNARQRMKRSATIRIRFVSNQAISDDLRQAIETRWTGKFENVSIGASVRADIALLLDATGLDPDQWQEFATALDFSECGTTSMQTLRSQVASAATEILGDDVSLEVGSLRTQVRELMLPHRTREIVTARDVLLWFGVSGRDGLFPCPPDLAIPPKTIAREVAVDIVRQLVDGNRLVVLHGGGGCGKTTLMTQVSAQLPSGSRNIIFDCFGGGRYTYSNDRRHLPENAFLQLTNDIAVALEIPLFVPRRNINPASINTLLKNLRAGGEALRRTARNALLLVVIDAADNSMAAAERWQESSFVTELLQIDFASLPDNVRFLVSCRTGRREQLPIPAGTVEVACPPFTLEETTSLLQASGLSVSEAVVRSFHSLSSMNPRVQAYAVRVSSGDRQNLLNALLPGGKSLPDVLSTAFEGASKKLGDQTQFDLIVGALAYLPAPISLSAVAACAGTNTELVRDFVLDLSPGLRLGSTTLTIADEDFEDFVEARAKANRASHLSRIAEHFLATYSTDAYSSSHIAEALVNAERSADLLAIIKADPHAAAVTDVVARRQVQAERLKLSLAACRDIGSVPGVLETVLISAEADRDDSTLRSMLTNELDLSVEFGASSLRRQILLDPGRVHQHGAFLVLDALRASRAGDELSAREQLLSYDAWLRRRSTLPASAAREWEVADRDICARTEVILDVAGPERALSDLLRWKPRTLAIRVGLELVPRLIAAGKSARLHALLAAGVVPKPWDLLIWVPFAMAGETIPIAEIEKSLKALKSRFVPHQTRRDAHSWEQRWFDLVVCACELAFALGVDAVVIERAIGLVLDTLRIRDGQQLYVSDAVRVDSLLKAWSLWRIVHNKETSADLFAEYVGVAKKEEVAPLPTKGRRKRKARTPPRGDNASEETRRKLSALFPIYHQRIQVLQAVRGKRLLPERPLKGALEALSRSYELDYGYDGMVLRGVAARSAMTLLLVGKIDPIILFQDACALLGDRSSGELDQRRDDFRYLLRLRSSEADCLLRDVAAKARVARHAHMAASEKVDVFVQLSRLLLPIAPEDARALFNEATEIAKEIDQEAFDQIEFLAALASKSVADQSRRRAIALDVFTFVSGAARRLSDRDHFPWQSAVSAVTSMDFGVGSAACARWFDEGLTSLQDTLTSLLDTALKKKLIRPEVATALALLIGGAQEDLIQESLNQAATPVRALIEEELAKQTLLLTPRRRQIDGGDALVARLTSPPSNPWVGILKKTAEFGKSLEPAEAHQSPVFERRVYRQEDQPERAFELDVTGKKFSTSDAILAELRVAEASGLTYRTPDLLRKMRDGSSHPRDRVPFLNALSGLPDDTSARYSRLDLICNLTTEWRDSPAVENWCREQLPKFLTRNFGSVARGLKKGGGGRFKELLDATGLSDDEKFGVLLTGLAQSGSNLSSRDLFGLAELIAHRLSAAESVAELEWYSLRLKDRLPVEDQRGFRLESAPDDVTSAVGRLVCAFMSDVDLRMRWRAAHALRCLARLKCDDFVGATIAESDRRVEPAFRDPTAPFYFMATKLWLVMALYRISEEAPAALSTHKAALYEIATSTELPHVALREYAKRTLLKLNDSAAISLTNAELRELELLNAPKQGTVKQKGNISRSFSHGHRGAERFKFDMMDTLPYWYSNIIRMFPLVSNEVVLARASQWIIDKWGADPEANRWDKEARKGRLNDPRAQASSSHRHGEIPTFERYGTHLEWHAMHCVVGELFEVEPLIHREQDFYATYDYWLSQFLPTEPPKWLSDLRGPLPLEKRIWTPNAKADVPWLARIRKDEFLEATQAQPIAGGEWLVIESDTTTQFRERSESTHVSSALVRPGSTAMALVRALQTVSSPYDFRIPDENDEGQIDIPPFHMIGWVNRVESVRQFDAIDPFRNGVGRIQCKPGRALSKFLGLRVAAAEGACWIGRKSAEPLLLYEAWSDPVLRDDAPSPEARTDGWRLLARPECVKEFLEEKSWNLIYEVQISRNLRNPYGRTYESKEKRKTHDKIFLFTAEGQIHDVRGCCGSWTDNSATIKAGSGRRYS